MKPEWWMERSKYGALVLSLGFLLPVAVAGPAKDGETARIDIRRSWNVGWEQISRGQFGSASNTFREAALRDDADPSLDHVSDWLEAYEALQFQREELRQEEFDLFVRRTEQEIARLNMKSVLNDVLGDTIERWAEEERARAESEEGAAEADEAEDDADETLWNLMRKRVKDEKVETDDGESEDLRDWHERLRDGIRGGVALVHARTNRARWVEVLDEARYAYLNAADNEEFRNDRWMTALVERAVEIAAEKRHEEKWMDASGIYYELELIYDLNPEYKKLRRECQTHARLESIYVGDKKWKRLVRGVDPEIVRQALGRIGTNYVRDADFREVVRSGLESILLLAKTPALRDTFEGLDDDFDREMFISRIESRIKKLDLEHELDIARDIQQALLPEKNPDLPGYDIAGWNKPADQTGGDCYDFINMQGHRLGILLADATGHGITAAMCIAQFRALVKATSRMSDDLSRIATYVNELLTEDLPSDRFVTCFVGTLDPDAHELSYIAAGQGPLLHFHADTQTADVLNASDLPMGIMDAHLFEMHNVLEIAPRDMVVLLTDGFFEWCGPNGEQYAEDRVIQVLKESMDLPAEKIIQRIYQSVRAFVGSAPQSDDLTAVIIKRISP